MIRILLADDQGLVRAGFRSILEKQTDFEVIGEAADGREALEFAASSTIDVVLMDIRMPVLDGLGATRELMQTPDPPRIIVLTTFDADEHIYQALHAGAAGFLLKDTSPERLVQAVRDVMTGESLLSPVITKRLIQAFVASPSPSGCAVPDAFRDLTARELEVLRVLAHGGSNAEIGQALFLAETTVKTHIARILAKLEVRDRVQAVVAAYEMGLVRTSSR